jgi:polysaccharide biosynthesis protein PslG
VRAGRLAARASALVGAVAAVVAVAAIGASALRDGAGDRTAPEPAPEPRGMLVGVASHPWVVEQHGLNTSFALLRRTNIRLLRIDVLWAAVEHSPDVFNWEQIDDVVRVADARGVRLIMAVHGTPGWANEGAGAARPPDRLSDFSRFCSALANRYQGHNVVYEIWNEENAPFGWGGGVQVRRYTALLQTAATAIRRGDPTGTVIVGGLARSSRPGVMKAVAFVKALYDTGARGSFDGIGFHPYARHDATARGSSMVTDIPDIRSLMVRNGDAAKDIWVTEFGYPVGRHHPAVEVARFERQAIIYAARHYPYVAAFVVYELTDEGGNGFGLFHNDLAIRAAGRMLGKLVGPDGAVVRRGAPPA